MKVKISKYPRRWSTSKAFDSYLAFRYDVDFGWKVKNYDKFDNFVEKLFDGWQFVLDHTVNKFVRRSQKIDVRIDSFDVWSLDHTLAYIIAPALQRLKDEKHGTPYVDVEDVPESLRGALEDGDPHSKGYSAKAWEYVLDEMIFAFTSINDDRIEDQFYQNIDQLKMEFVKTDDCPDGFSELKFTKGPDYFYDREGHAAFQKRQDNGFRLFGKYYRSLWD